jgi:hypothetical protein
VTDDDPQQDTYQPFSHSSLFHHSSAEEREIFFNGWDDTDRGKSGYWEKSVFQCHFHSFIPQRVLRRVRSLSKTSPLPTAISASSLIPVPSLFVIVIHNCLRLFPRFSVPHIFPSTRQMKQKYLCFISLLFTLPADQLVQRYLATVKEPF